MQRRNIVIVKTWLMSCLIPLPLFPLRGLYPTSTMHSFGATLHLGVQASPPLGLCMWPRLSQSHSLSRGITQAEETIDNIHDSYSKIVTRPSISSCHPDHQNFPSSQHFCSHVSSISLWALWAPLYPSEKFRFCLSNPESVLSCQQRAPDRLDL